MVRQFADKPNGIAQEEGQVLDGHLTNGSIQGSKEFILRKDITLREQVHHRRFAHIGIAHQSHTHHLTTILALGSHLFVDDLQFLAQQRLNTVIHLFTELIVLQVFEEVLN